MPISTDASFPSPDVAVHIIRKQSVNFGLLNCYPDPTTKRRTLVLSLQALNIFLPNSLPDALVKLGAHPWLELAEISKALKQKLILGARLELANTSDAIKQKPIQPTNPRLELAQTSDVITQKIILGGEGANTRLELSTTNTEQ